MSEGSYLTGGVRTLVSGFFWSRVAATDAVRQAIQRDRDVQGLWRVSEGGQRPVANLVSITPEIDGLLTPAMRRNPATVGNRADRRGSSTSDSGSTAFASTTL